MAYTFAQIIAINDSGGASHGQQYTDVRGNVYVGNADGTFTIVKKTEIIPFDQGNASYLVLGISPILKSERKATGSADISITDQGPKKNAIFALTNTGVTSGQYGSATQIPQFTVDAKGRITSAVNITLSGLPPGGAAGGDLAGLFPNPTVAKINTVPLGSTTATDRNILIADGTQWVSHAVSGDATLTANTGTLTLATVNASVGTFGDSTHVAQFTVNAKGLITSASDILISALADPGANGIIVRTALNTTTARTIVGSANISVVNGSGVAANPTLDLITTGVISGSYGSATQVATFTVDTFGRLSAAGNVTISGTTPGGAAGGDLAGTFPNPTVAKINTVPLGSTTATDRNILIADGTQWVSRSVSGDATLTANTGTLTLATVNANVGSFGSATQVAQFTVNAKGLITAASTITINALADTGSNGIVVRTALNTTISRSIIGSANIGVTNGSGVAGNPTLDLTTTTVVAGSYGSATQVAQFTVDTFGRLSAAGNVTITGTVPGGAAGGDLAGTYPNPTVAKINTVPLGVTTATDRNILIADGTQWVSRAVSGDATLTANTGTLTLATVNANVGTFGSATQTVTFTVNAKGLITAASQQTVTPAASSITGGQALSKVDDTNITLTLGGTPAASLLAATSLTLGWAGQLSLARGGSNASLVADNGGIVYSTASALAVLAGTATANQVLLSGASAAPAWSTATYPATTTINQLLYSSAANTIAGLATANNGVLVTSGGGVPSISTSLPSAIDAQYVLVNGTRALTGNWGAGAFSATFNSVVVGSTANNISGGTAAGGNLTLNSTTNVTKGLITLLPLTLNEGSPFVGVNTTATNGLGKLMHIAYASTSQHGLLIGRAMTADAANAITTINTQSSYIHLGAREFNTNSYRLISFGYVNNVTVNFPAYIGYQETSNSGNTMGDLIFGTRAVTTDTAPTERMRITAAGIIAIADGVNITTGTTTGTQIALATQKLSVYGKTPIVQPAGATQAALINNTAGTYDGTLQAIASVGTNLLVAASTADVNTAIAAIRNNFTDVWTLLDAIRTALVSFGPIKGSA